MSRGPSGGSRSERSRVPSPWRFSVGSLVGCVAAAAVALWIVRVWLGLEGDSIPSILLGLLAFFFAVGAVLLLVIMPALLAYAILVEPDSARLDRRLREVRLGRLREEDDR